MDIYVAGAAITGTALLGFAIYEFGLLVMGHHPPVKPDEDYIQEARAVDMVDGPEQIFDFNQFPLDHADDFGLHH